MDSYKKTLILIFSGTVFSFLSLTAIAVFIDPYCEGSLGKILFFISIFLSFLGFFTITGFYLRKWLLKREAPFFQIKNSFRQGIFFSLILTSFLILQTLRMFNWITIAIVVGGGILAEGITSK